MKVLVVSYLLDPQRGGGAATAALRLCQGLVERGVEVVALTTHDEPQPRTATQDGIRIHAFRPRNLYWVADKSRQPWPKKVVWQLIDIWNPQVYRYLRAIIERERPDVVHVHKMRGLSPAVWSAAAAEQCAPIVQTCHDYEAVSPEGLLDSAVGRMALERHPALRPYQAARARASRAVHVVTAPSRFTLDTVTGLGFFDRARPVVVPNSHGFRAAELAGLADAAGRPGDDTFRYLYLGRLETVKGIDVLLRAFAAIAAAVPHVRLDVAGDGSRGDALRATYGGLPQVRFHGHVAGEEKRRLIAAADALVMPSIVREVFGISIAEAYAFGKPVIAARIGGMPELVRAGQTGLLVEPGDEAGLQEALGALAADRARTRAMAPACAAAARAYTLEAVTEQYLNAYEAGRQPSPQATAAPAGASPGMNQ
jgi:glycosyltransferase involved in cell wall biosynthesis